jgi:hypothetical protein
MCEKCDEIERTIRRFRQVRWSISDELTVQQARQVIADLEAHKGLVHAAPGYADSEEFPGYAGLPRR